MLTYPKWLSPDLLHLGPVRVRWYGVMYLLGIVIARLICRSLAKTRYLKIRPELVDDFLIFLFVGMLLGARLLYMAVYYQPMPGEEFHWYTPIAVWEGGLAFHGAVIGMVIACAIFGKIHKVSLWNLSDTLALAGSQGIIWGRIGNFINSELIGRETNSFFAMQFPVRDFEGNILGYTSHRHPSQLYEAVGEGLLPFLIIWLIRPKIKYQGIIGGIWLCLYAIARFFIEFYREKDAQMDYYLGMTMGQVLCAVMFVAGLGVIVWNQIRAVPVYSHEENVGTNTPIDAKSSPEN